MKGFAIAAVSALVWTAAQTQAVAQPATPAPARRPAPAAQAPAAVAPAPQPPAVFPQGARLAFVNLQAIAQLSADGKAATAKVQALAQKKQSEGAAKTKTLQDNQAKLQSGGSVMNQQARAQLEKDIERQTVEAQRFEQDAQAELTELQQQLQQEFQSKLLPILERLSKEKGLQALLSAADSGVVWADPGLDLTMDAVKNMDAGGAAPKAPAPATPKPQ